MWLMFYPLCKYYYYYYYYHHVQEGCVNCCKLLRARKRTIDARQRPPLNRILYVISTSSMMIIMFKRVCILELLYNYR
jgi:hypothetical protein